MSNLTDAEQRYLQSERRLARVATVGPDGTPHVTPVGWSYDAETDAFEVTGHDFAATKKFNDVRRRGRAALVIDDVLPPWQPRGIEVRGRAEALSKPSARIRIYPERIISWGIDEGQRRNARSIRSPTAESDQAHRPGHQ